MTFISNTGAGSGSPVFDYSSRDYVSIYNDLLNRIAVYLPEWTSRSNSDFGIVLLQMYAYVGDLLGYYLDRLVGEAFLQTATQPQSIINLATMLGYTPALSNGASTTLLVTISENLASSAYPVTIPAGTVFSTLPSSTIAAIPFVTTSALTIPGSSVNPAVYTGTVAVEQGIQYVENVTTSNGTINQTYALQYSPVSANSLTVTVDLGQGPQEWEFLASLVDAGPNDLVYTNYVDANQTFYLVFGDGVNGYIPVLGSPIAATYMTNVGDLGNVGPNTITVYGGPPPGSQPVIGIIGVTNTSAASGGAPTETIQSIQQNAPSSLQALNRGVTTSDIAALAQSISGVQWASVVEQTYQLVNLYIAPSGGGTLSTLLIDQISAQINEVVMANTTVTVLTANYIPIDISVQVFVFENFSNSVVQQNVQTALNDLLSLANTGFGFRVALGLVYETVLAVDGVNYAFVTQLSRGVFCELQTALYDGGSYSVLGTTPLPQQVNLGDVIVLTSAAVSSNQQTVRVLTTTGAGSFAIPVFAFTANANYPAGSDIQDTTILSDASILSSEIPVAGTVRVSVSGGSPV